MNRDTSRSDERLKILSMVEDGTITADEAAKMLTALEEVELEVAPGSKGPSPKWIHIQVLDEKDKVDIRLPFGLIRIAESFIPTQAREEMSKNGINLNELTRMMESSGHGKLVEVQEEGGAYVAITLE